MADILPAFWTLTKVVLTGHVWTSSFLILKFPKSAKLNTVGVFMLRKLKGFLLGKLKRSLYPEGRIATIFAGPLRGYRIRISPRTGWSPIAGTWQYASQDLFCKLLQPGQIVYDLGANIGFFTMIFSKCVGEAGKVFAFEPLPENLAELGQLMKLNNIQNVDVVPVAVSDRDGTARFELGNHDTQGSLVGIGQSRGEFIDVTIRSLDSLVAGGMAPPDVLKIDIEGAEGLALEGCREVLRKHHPTFVIDLHTPEQDLEVGAILAAFGYNVWRMIDRDGLPYLSRVKLERIQNLHASWPNVEGIWGVIVAAHPSRMLQKLIDPLVIAPRPQGRPGSNLQLKPN